MLGVLSSIIGNELSIRFGRTHVVVAIMCFSSLLAVLIGNILWLSATWLIFFVLFYGCLVTADSASITSGLIESAAKEKRGITMAVHSSIGFIGSFLGPIGFGIVLNFFGGHQNSEAWFWAFSSTGLVLILGPMFLLLFHNFNNKK